MTGTYDVYALRYSSRPAERRQEFYRYEQYGATETGSPLRMDYYFWLIRNGDRTVLVDCGFDQGRAAARGRTQETSPALLLQRLGVAPADVDHIIITHLHYDHVGNVQLFPRATFSLARDELAFWTGPHGRRNPLASTVHPEEVQIMRRLHDEGRVSLLDSPRDLDLAPGIAVTQVGGHTPGQLIVRAASPGGDVVLASDAMHYYEEVELNRPYHLFTDLEGMYRGYDLIRALQQQARTTVVAEHDPIVQSDFEAVAEDCFDLSKQLPG